MKKWFDKRGIAFEVMGWWILAIAVLVIILVGYFILSEKGIDAISYIRNMLRFGK